MFLCPPVTLVKDQCRLDIRKYSSHKGQQVNGTNYLQIHCWGQVCVGGHDKGREVNRVAVLMLIFFNNFER